MFQFEDRRKLMPQFNQLGDTQREFSFPPFLCYSGPQQLMQWSPLGESKRERLPALLRLWIQRLISSRNNVQPNVLIYKINYHIDEHFSSQAMLTQVAGGRGQILRREGICCLARRTEVSRSSGAPVQMLSSHLLSSHLFQPLQQSCLGYKFDPAWSSGIFMLKFLILSQLSMPTVIADERFFICHTGGVRAFTLILCLLFCFLQVI